MSMPQQAPPVDAGNALLAETPAQLSTALLGTPAGQRMALTIRTASTTLTVLPFVFSPTTGQNPQGLAAVLGVAIADGTTVALPSMLPPGWNRQVTSLCCRDGGFLTWAAKPSVRESPNPAINVGINSALRHPCTRHSPHFERLRIRSSRSSLKW